MSDVWLYWGLEVAKSLALVATNMDVGKAQCTEGAPLVLMDLSGRPADQS